MLTRQEFTEFVEDITSGDLSSVVATLEDLRDYPSADARVLPYLSRLLYDKNPCVIAIPFVFAEVRWLAAHALAAERAALGIQKPVCLRQIVKPLDTGGIVRAEYAAGIEPRGGVDGLLMNFGILNDMGYLPLYDLNLSYWIEEEREQVPPQEPILYRAVPALAVA